MAIFQSSHFGVHETPETWFIDAETALSYEPWLEEDELGYYKDGAKRTITDEQIVMFRNSEVEALRRGQSLRVDYEVPAASKIRGDGELSDGATRSGSPASDVSSLEDDLVGLARTHFANPTRPAVKRQSSRAAQGTFSHSAFQGRQRNGANVHGQPSKRKWEAYIDQNDQSEDAMTHRRIARELDEQLDANVALDY